MSNKSSNTSRRDKRARAKVAMTSSQKAWFSAVRRGASAGVENIESLMAQAIRSTVSASSPRGNLVESTRVLNDLVDQAKISAALDSIPNLQEETSDELA